MQNITCSQSCASIPCSQHLLISGVLVCYVRCCPSDLLDLLVCFATNACLHPHASLGLWKLSSLYSSSAGLSRHRWCLVSGELQFASISLMTPNYTLAPALAWPRQKLQILHSNYHSSLGSYLELSSQLFVE